MVASESLWFEVQFRLQDLRACAGAFAWKFKSPSEQQPDANGGLLVCQMAEERTLLALHFVRTTRRYRFLKLRDRLAEPLCQHAPTVPGKTYLVKRSSRNRRKSQRGSKSQSRSKARPLTKVAA